MGLCGKRGLLKAYNRPLCKFKHLKKKKLGWSRKWPLNKDTTMATDERAVDMELVASHHIQSVSYYMLTAHTIKKRVGGAAQQHLG